MDFGRKACAQQINDLHQNAPTYGTDLHKLESAYFCHCCVVGFGVEQLRDGSLDTYWQSDGPQPHLINVQFRRKMTISDICIYADYKADESYTPNRCVMVTLNNALNYWANYGLLTITPILTLVHSFIHVFI